MPRSRPAHRARPAASAAASDVARGAPPDGAAPRLDGRRAHVLDRAAEYVRLHREGLAAAEIARRRRKSRAHVSILLRLGQALADLPDDERLALRHPRVTWRLVQGLVRRDTDAASLRRQLRAALGGFSTHNVDRRRRRGAAAVPAAAPAPGVAWGWDAAWFARDPAGYAAAHLAHLAHLHQAVAARAEHAVRARTAAALDAGQGLRALQRRIAAAAHGPAPGAALTPDERAALATFAAIGRALGGVDAPGRAAPTPPDDRGDESADLLDADLQDA